MARKSTVGNETINSEPVGSVAPNDNGNGGTPEQSGTIDPASLAGNSAGNGDDGLERDEFGNIKYNADGSPRKRRGRKPGASGGSSGGSNRKPSKASETNLGGVEAVLFSLHAMAAAAFKAPELALDKKEAEQLAVAVAAVADHYPMTIAPKTMAWVNLVMASAAIYGPRIYLIRERLKKESEQKPASESVVSFMPGGFGGT